MVLPKEIYWLIFNNADYGICQYKDSVVLPSGFAQKHVIYQQNTDVEMILVFLAYNKGKNINFI